MTTQSFLVNPGGGRYRFHGAFAKEADAKRREREVGGFIKPTTVGGRRRFMVLSEQAPRRRRGNIAKRSPTISEVPMARRTRRRKHSAKRRRRRSASRALLATNRPKRARRLRASGKRRRRSSARRMHSNPRGFGGIVGRVMRAGKDGLAVTAGVAAQNGGQRLLPNVVPASSPMAPTLNPILKDVVTLVAGTMLAHKFVNGDTARLVVAGQSHAIIARFLRGLNVPVASSLLGEYDPVRLGTYVRGVRGPAVGAAWSVRQPPSRGALPAGGASAERIKQGVGIYTDGVATSPSIY